MRSYFSLFLFPILFIAGSITALGDSCTFATGVTGSCSVSAAPGVTATGDLSLVSGPVPDPSMALAAYPQYQNLGFTTAYGLVMNLTLTGEPGQDGTLNAQFTLPAQYGNWVIYGNLGWNYADNYNQSSTALIDGYSFDASSQEVQAYLLPHAPGDPMVVDASVSTSVVGSDPVNATLYLELLGDAPLTVPEPALWPLSALVLTILLYAAYKRRTRTAAANIHSL